MKTSVLTLAFTAALAAAPAAQADVVYTYTGNAFELFRNDSNATYTAANHISGSFTLADGAWSNLDQQTISPLAFDFTDGRVHLTTANFETSFQVSTDAAGQITSWRLYLFAPLVSGLGYDTIYSTGGVYGSVDMGEHYNPASCASSCVSRGTTFAAGSWSVTGLTPLPVDPPAAGALPEPQGLALALAALLALPAGARLGRRRRG
jgi:hypothetical protein